MPKLSESQHNYDHTSKNDSPSHDILVMRRESASIQGRDPNNNLAARAVSEMDGQRKGHFAASGTYNMARIAMVNEGATREYVVNETKGPSVSPAHAGAITGDGHRIWGRNWWAR